MEVFSTDENRDNEETHVKVSVLNQLELDGCLVSRL